MKNAPVRHALGYAAYRVLKTSVLALSHDSARRLGRRLGSVLYRLPSTARRRTLANLERVYPQLEPAERRRIARECFRHFGGHFLEVASISRFGRDEIENLFEIEGWEHVEEARARARGIILTAGHYGSWELSSHVLQLRLGNLAAVVRPLDNPRIDRDLSAMRERLGIRLLNKARAGHRMINALRRGETPCIVIDQHVRPENGIPLPFLGHPAWTSTTLAVVSLHTRAPVLHHTAVPLGERRYRISFQPPIYPDGEGREGERLLTRRYLEAVEADVRSRPELWLWMHRRWRYEGGGSAAPAAASPPPSMPNGV